MTSAYEPIIGRPHKSLVDWSTMIERIFANVAFSLVLPSCVCIFNAYTVGHKQQVKSDAILVSPMGYGTWKSPPNLLWVPMITVLPAFFGWAFALLQMGPLPSPRQKGWMLLHTKGASRNHLVYIQCCCNRRGWTHPHHYWKLLLNKI